ncbi:MAG: hypothetical protein BEN19_00310 [Epulopiscium sp. Nuni2H_MBin003]|nr:MAG: hypothetical protein BEN19_00310 [Epulopiscium sp. Nuni2H_MBin003]
MILAIYGNGGLGKDIFILAKQIEQYKLNFWNKIIFINDYDSKTLIKEQVYTFEQFRNTYKADQAKIVIAVGEPKYRKLLYDKVKEMKYELATLIHPRVYIHDYLNIKEGCIISEGTFVGINVTIGHNTLIGISSVVLGHDVRVGANSVISGHSFIGGNVVIGDLCYLGAGVKVKEKVKISNKCIIGMGSVIIKDIVEEVVAVGNPARIVRKNEDLCVY